MTTATQEKKVLIHIDKKGIEHARQLITNAAGTINLFIDTAEADLSRTFTDEEKEQLYKHGIHWIESELKEQYPFPKSDQETNLKLLGVDLRHLRKCHNTYYHTWLKYPQKLVNGRFEVEDLDNRPEIKAKYIYAENEKQEIAYKRASELCKLLNTMDSEGLLNQHSKHLIGNSIPIVYIATEDGERKYRPSKSGIRMIRE